MSWTPDHESDGDDTSECPYCRKQIYADSPRCPHCGNYISAEDSVPARKPWWIIVGALFCLFAVYRWIVG